MRRDGKNNPVPTTNQLVHCLVVHICYPGWHFLSAGERHSGGRSVSVSLWGHIIPALQLAPATGDRGENLSYKKVEAKLKKKL